MVSKAKTAVMDPITRMRAKAEEFRKNHADRSGPGYSQNLTRANLVNEGVPQGDYYIWVSRRKKAPKGWVRRHDPALVPNAKKGTVGSQHRVSDDTMAGCELWFPPDWETKGEDDPSTKGPMIICKDNVTIIHPTHGFLHCEAGMVLESGYQKNFDLILKKRRRSRD